jgi:hypothetical protein
MPPRPGGVAIATMVSVVENIQRLAASGWRLVAENAEHASNQQLATSNYLRSEI